MRNNRVGRQKLSGPLQTASREKAARFGCDRGGKTIVLRSSGGPRTPTARSWCAPAIRQKEIGLGWTGWVLHKSRGASVGVALEGARGLGVCRQNVGHTTYAEDIQINRPPSNAVSREAHLSPRLGSFRLGAE